MVDSTRSMIDRTSRTRFRSVALYTASLERKTMPEPSRNVHIHSVRSVDMAASVRTFKRDPARYAERAIWMASPGDVVCLHEPVDSRYLSFLNQIGIGPRSADVVHCEDGRDESLLTLSSKFVRLEEAWERLRTRLVGASRIVLHCYMATRFEVELARHIESRLNVPVLLLGSSEECVNRFSQKHHVRELAQQLDIPIAPGCVVETTGPAGGKRLAEAIGRWMRPTGRAIIRGIVGNGGSSVYVVENANEIASRVAELQRSDRNNVFLVESMFEVTRSPNVCIYIDPETGSVERFSCSEQVMRNGLVHIGNESPIQTETLPEMIATAERMAAWLRDHGVTGHLGFDFCEYKGPDGGARFFLAELNPRINGATYVQTILETLNRAQVGRGGKRLTAFYAQTRDVPFRTFAELEAALAPWMFRSDVDASLVPGRMGLLKEGKCDLAVLGTSSAAVKACWNAVLQRVAERTRAASPGVLSPAA